MREWNLTVRSDCKRFFKLDNNIRWQFRAKSSTFVGGIFFGDIMDKLSHKMLCLK